MNRAIVCTVLLTALVGIGTAPQGAVRFVDVSAEAGVKIPYFFGHPERPWVTDSGGSGAGFLDLDRDGWVDLLVLAGLPGPSSDPAAATRAGLAGDPLPASRREDGTVPTHVLLRNDAGRFERAPAWSGLADTTWASGVAVGDYDDDGFPDVYVTSIGPNRMYRNNGDGSFAAVDLGVEDDGWSSGAAFVDWGQAGLDLYVTNYVDFDADATASLGDGVCFYLSVEVFCGPEGLVGQQDVFLRHQGEGFVPWLPERIDAEATFGFAVLPFDCDGAAPQEIYVANDSDINLLYRRSGDDVEELSLLSGAGFSGTGLAQAGMGATSADFDEDGDFDLLVSNFQHDYNTLYENIGDCLFVDATADRGLAAAAYPFMGWASLFFDADGDGDQDLFVANGHLYPQLQATQQEPYGQRDLLFLNRLRETASADFDEVGASAGAPFALERVSRSAARADFDNDYDVDLFVTRIDESPVLLRNDATMAHAALRVTLRGRGGNRDAYGAQLRVISGSTSQSLEVRHGDGYLGSNDTRGLIFLPSGQADRLIVEWPSGATTESTGVQPGSVVIDEHHGIVAQRR